MKKHLWWSIALIATCGCVEYVSNTPAPAPTITATPTPQPAQSPTNPTAGVRATPGSANGTAKPDPLAGKAPQTKEEFLQEIVELRGQAMRYARNEKMPEAYATFVQSGQLAQKLLALNPELDADETPLVHEAIYNLACGLAQTGKVDEAFAALQQVVDMGFANAKMLREDTDLDPLRERDDFKQLSTKLASEEKK